MLNKLPSITFAFWVIKILTTGMGEAASDFLVRWLGSAPAVVIGGLVFLVSLAVQLRRKSFSKWVYWTAVAMVSVFGTMAADIVHIGLGVPYVVSTVVFTVGLIAIFAIWWRTEGSISLASVTTARREVFYWLTVLATFALGTAAGDLTARNLNWGYLGSGLVFAAAFAVPAICYRASSGSSVLLFWLAYIITRPLGASFADWIGADTSKGGLGFGFGSIAAVLTVAIVVVVGLQPSEAKSSR
jgi:uncharacterized membrane-anchored protein